jgi:tetratricopeptide (TPR) repeat protein
MSPLLRSACTLAVVFSAGADFADPQPAAPIKDQIAKWIKQLADADFDIRQKASEQIWNATDDDTAPLIEAALKEAIKSDDTEVVRRASELLDRLQLGINVKTPKKIADLAQSFRGTDDAARQEAIKGLFASGAPGLKVLLRLIDAEKDPAAKESLAQQASTEVLAAIPPLMANGDRASVEELLDLSLLTNQPAAHLSYAVYWLRYGKLADRIRILEAAKPAKPERHAALLATLYRVHADYPKARAAAEKSENEELLNAVLFDQGDWKELANRAAKTAIGSNDPHVLGLLASYQRLAGDAKGTEQTLTRIGENSKNTDHGKSAQALLLNGRPKAALRLITAGKNRLEAVEMYSARFQFKEALRILNAKDLPDPKESSEYLEILRARTLFLLGERETAVNVFKKLGETIGTRGAGPHGLNYAWVLPKMLIPQEFSLGLEDLAYHHTSMAIVMDTDCLHLTLESAFPERGEMAAVWWQYLTHKHPNDEPADTMNRLRAVLDGRVALQALTALVKDAMEVAGNMRVEVRERWFIALAESCKDAGADTLRKNCLERAVAAAEEIASAQKNRPTDPPYATASLALLAEFYANKKDWTQAAEYYEQVLMKTKPGTVSAVHGPIVTFLRGHALVQAGQEMEGKRLIELAHVLPLADGNARYICARELDKLGHVDAARRECELIIRVNGFNGFDGPWHTEEAFKALAQHARAERNYARAADYYERAVLCHMHSESDYSLSAADLVLPALVHSNRAMALLIADKLDDAQREFQTCLDILPGDMNLPILLMPELEKKGHKTEAADLFAKVWTVHDGLCRDYPKSAWAHNNTAWLAARCRRNLDEALKHAQQAVELAPENAGYLNTLAEVYFLKGDKDKALELTKKCIKMDPKCAYFQRQLKRIEAGDASVDVPE